MLHTALVNHLVRRTYQEATQEWTIAPSDDNVKTFQLSTWALTLLSVTSLLYFLVMAGVRFLLAAPNTYPQSNIFCDRSSTLTAQS